MLLAASLLAVASAHNWINGPSRVSLDKFVASTVAPVVPNPNDEPHVVVRAGQKFQFEWVTGHNQDVYIIILAKKDAAMMKQHEVTMMEAFLKDAKCPQGVPPAQWINYHYKYNDNSTDFFPPAKDGVTPPTMPAVYKRRVPPSDPNFIPRDKAFKKSMKGMPKVPNYSLIAQFEYKDADISANRRCVPDTPVAKYPWVIAMHKYRIMRHQPTEPDVTWLQLPADTPAGDYIVHWRWRGYYDAVDVKVVASSTDVPNPFGGGTGTTSTGPVTRFKRIDHCSFPGATSAGACKAMTVASGKLATPDACLTACKAMSIDKCDGVAVVPLVNPDAVADAFQNMINIPSSCAKPTDGSTHVCFPLLQAEPTQTENSFFTTTDVEDPAFYSTCFRRADAVKRDGLPDPSTLPYITADVPDWKAYGRCISCADQDKFTKADVTPVWTLANSCINCDIAAKK